MTRSLERIEAELQLREKINEARKRSFDSSLSEPERVLEGQRILAMFAQFMRMKGEDPDRLVSGSLGCASSTGEGRELREWKAREAARVEAEADGEGLDASRFYSAVGKSMG